ncbi:methyltransferase domain-containing protein [Noviherbaspirillum cavernae]|uniref:Methyltransferase domain-containing protein n=1 Tax=Noviherbaspirillum cavernae TaxID=2320862 RepID=A0A418X0F4_9BURK|nr:class I SAM-dependent methyltransferase [Noviherbaspirillum cavernae]RJG05974.1 methyltransferase domain-containing protein [Noviherbaspirillum cavernae]
MTHSSTCRSCGAPLDPVRHTFADLGLSPVSNAFVKPENAARGEMFYPLHALVCERCWLVQLSDVSRAEAHFHDDYVYFSSFSSSWLAHARRYVDMMIPRFGLDAASRVVEIASNDGYLLQYFVQAGIPSLGVEPTANTAAAARKVGVESREMFFGRDTAAQLAAEGGQVDLLLGNNVLAHVPDINDFVGGMPLLLKPQGVITLEFPHLLNLMAQNQFDTLYHEHYSYLSLTALVPIFQRAGLRFFDVEHLPTHGGSLRVYACHHAAAHAENAAVADCLKQEAAAGLTQLATYAAFGEKVRGTKRALLDFLLAAKREGRRIAAYGAAAKGNTLLNYCGVGTDFIDYAVDKNPVKQGRLLPGTRIPVRAPETVFETHPDYLLILPWNIKEEVMQQMADIRTWGGKFVVPIPSVEVIA